MLHAPDGTAPKLLVSVRDVPEAEAAIVGGVDVVDIKEPRRGSLGRANAAVVSAIVRQVRRRSPSTRTSAACGELVQPGGDDAGWRPSAEPSLRKIGLAGARERDEWPRLLRNWCDAATGPWVGVIYADWQRAAAPPPDAVLDVVLELGCLGVLVDTYDKSVGTLADVLPADELATLLRRVRAAGRFSAVAGRLGIDDLPWLLPLAPDVVAVRSAVCTGADRTAAVTRTAVRRFRRALDEVSAQTAG